VPSTGVGPTFLVPTGKLNVNGAVVEIKLFGPIRGFD
jgi:hypothetical protein